MLLLLPLFYRFDMRPNPWAVGFAVMLAFYFGSRLFEQRRS
jgi:hypothetical protein